MPNNQNLFRILWHKISGSYREAFQKGDYKGLVTAIAVKGGRLILASVSLGMAGVLLEPVSDFVIKNTVGVLWESAAKVVYQVRSSPSGLAILENPRIITPSRKIYTPPKLVVPSSQIIEPTPPFKFNPSQPLFPRNLTSLSGNRARAFAQQPVSRNWTSPRLQNYGTTSAWNALLSQGAGQQRLGMSRSLPSLRSSTNLPRSLQSMGSYTDVAYPKWVFQQNPFNRGRQIGGRQVLANQSYKPFFNHYMSNQQQARQFRTAVQELAQTAPSRDDRNVWEKLADKIDDFLDEWL